MTTPLDKEDFRRYSWKMMLAGVGTYDKIVLDRMGRPVDHGQKGVARERQFHDFNERRDAANTASAAKPPHPFKNYHFTNHQA